MKIETARTQLATYEECLEFAIEARELDLVSKAGVKNNGTSDLGHAEAVEFARLNIGYISETIAGVVSLAVHNK